MRPRRDCEGRKADPAGPSCGECSQQPAAARTLLADYAGDPKVTAFTALDGEPWRETSHR